MASLVGSSNHHGLSSLVLNRSRPNSLHPPPSAQAGMPPPLPQNFVVVSDDEEEANDEIEHIRTQIRDRPEPLTIDAGSSSHIRPDVEGSSPLRRHGKRQKMLDGSTSLAERTSSSDAAASPPGFTRAHLNFDNDGQFTQLYPEFFADAFIEENRISEIPPPSKSKRPKKEIQPPYFDDPKLHIRMFRGPGCEIFTLPVDSSSIYKEFCDEYDRKMLQKEERRRSKQTRYNQFGPYIDELLEVETSDDEDEPGPKKTPVSTLEAECLAQILEILPDVNHDFVLGTIRTQHESWDFGGEEIEVLPDTSAIVAELLEMDDYPKAKKAEEMERDPFEDETGKTIKWDKDHRNHRDYQKDAIILLASQFDHIPTHFISKIVHEKRTIWDAYLHLEDVETAYFQRVDKPYSRSRRPRIQLEKKYQRSLPYHDPQYYPSLVTELQAVRQHVARDVLRRSQDQAKIDAEKANLEEQRAQGLIIECQCCFDDEVPMNRSVSCVASSGEHSFCFGCVENLANSQIGLMKHEMLCMDGSGCQEKLDIDGIGRAVPIKTFDCLLFNEQQNEIAAANIEGLEQCPFCDFKAICEPIEDDPIFSCQNPDCFRVTCRKCHETSHLPRTCEEVKKDRGLSARHKIEEARSEAMMRPCPQCKKKLIKEIGCNKMRCTCGAVICYVCKLDLSKLRDGYDHFNKGDRKCPLYDTPGVDRHDLEADDAERQAIEKAKAEDATIEESILQIETGKDKTAARPAAAPSPPALNALPPRAPARNQELRERLDAVRGHIRAQARIGRRARPALAAPIMRAPPPQPILNMPQNGAMEPQYAHINNPAAPIANAPGLVNNAGIRTAELGQFQDRFMGPNAVPEQWGQFGGDLYDNVWPQRSAALDNELDMLVEGGHRIHNYRADMARRREAQLQRRNTIQNHTNLPLELPNPAFLNIRNDLRRPTGSASQQQAHPANQQVKQGHQDHALGGWLPDIPQNDGPFDPFGGFGEPLNMKQPWRDQFRPATPLPATNGMLDRGRPFRRQTMPNNAFNVGGYQQNNGAADPATLVQQQQRQPYGWI